MDDINKYREPRKVAKLRLMGAVVLLSSCAFPFLSLDKRPWMLLSMIMIDGVIVVVGLFFLNSHPPQREVLIPEPQEEKSLEPCIVSGS